MALPLSYNWRNLFVRKFSTLLTFTVVALVVLVLSVLLSFAAGIRASLANSGSPQNLIVLKPGATAESTSFVLQDDIDHLVQTPGVARDDADRLLVSPELCVQTSIPRKGPEGTMANVAVRGVDDVAFDVHRDVKIIAGRRMQPGRLEVIVGKAARDRYSHMELDDEVPMGRLGNREYKVVGVFEAGGGALENEIWAPRTMLADSYQRRQASSVALGLVSPDAAKEAIAYITGPTVRLEAKTETKYYEDLAAKTREIVVLTMVLVGIMAVGAVFAVANTMYAAVDRRRREIAMLRTIGFSRGSIMTAFVIESLLICLAACVVGLAGSMLYGQIGGQRQDFLSDTTWTVLAYDLRVTWDIIVVALVLAAAVGVGGAMAPAYRASRTHVIDALRKA